MNPLFKPTNEESRVIEIINNYNLNEFALIRMTPTMIDKSIIDASYGLRKILFDNKLIDFKDLTPGGAKKYKDSIILTDSIIETKTSFYRPKSKNGDPRFWPYNLTKYVKADELIYLTIHENRLIAIPVRDVPSINQNIKNVLGDPEESEVVVKLKKQLSVLRSIGNIESISPNKRAPKDVGMTLEHFLGIKVNSLKTPDYLGKIEIKSKRDDSKKDSLFSKVPDKEISNYKKVKDIIQKFGYYDKVNERIALYNDITTKPNNQGLYLFPANDDLILYQKFRKDGSEDEVCAWYYETLKKSLEIKHPTTLWVDAQETLNTEGKIQFKYKNFELTTKPVFSEFISLIERDLINFDWKGHIKNGKKRDHGPGFRIDKVNRKYLFKSLINITYPIF
jgi:hypothetical protein